MTGTGLTAVLMVDDEPNILDGYRRALNGRFRVVPARSGDEALTVLQRATDQGQPFPVIVSDMKMPGMSGAEFLGRAAELSPDTIQMLLSGQADLESTIAAVNNGNLFRFLSKPCSGADMESAIGAAVRQYELVMAERELLEKTLTGGIAVLTDVLSMASSEAYARTQRVHTLVMAAAKILPGSDWQLPIAAMLSQIGCVAVPSSILQRALTGKTLSDEESAVFLGHPRAARTLLERIPRLEQVARWVGEQPVRPAPSSRTGAVGALATWDISETPETQAQALFCSAVVYVNLGDAGTTPKDALAEMAKAGHHPRAVLDALTRASGALSPTGTRRELTVDFLAPAMVLLEDVLTTTGMTLVRKGERLTQATVMRLDNFHRTVGVIEPVVVLERG